MWTVRVVNEPLAVTWGPIRIGLELYYNRLNGTIPESLGSLTGLQCVVMLY
jgi:hypothetical protein